MTPHDLGPAASEMVRVAGCVRDGQLGAPTPCDGWTVRDLVGHVLGLTAAFTAAARKETLHGDAPDGLPAGWRDLLHRQADDLAQAWRRPEAWQGEAKAGGVTMPGDVMGVVALDELVLHGWDLARATGQRFDATLADVEACTDFAAAVSGPGQEDQRQGLYGPVVPVPDDAPALDRLLGLAGRDPGWQPA